ncbi:hypothetical protein PIROE2DRAFT_16580 [Piromyces sp. E2]|nr:hypothetical protein PIROE2DRAFT_16580 [Piromyces sp. E2]|eukprot:OUM58208.1 hypothetical protein PIROE2DRAFT_16580 [Piromyces sp. E2]
MDGMEHLPIIMCKEYQSEFGPSNPSNPTYSSSIKWENQYGKIDKEAKVKRN